MGVGLGWTAMARGAAAGLEDIERRDREEEDRQYLLKRREREDTAWQQQQEDRDYTLRRREVTDKREDEDYQMRREAALRTKQVQDAMRTFGASNFTDLSGYVDIANAYMPDGKIVDWKPTGKGTFLITKQTEDGKTVTKEVDADDIGANLQLLADPNKWYEAEQAKKAKAAERDFELTKIRTRGEEDRKTERVKARLKEGEGLGVGSKADKELRLRVSQGLGVLQGAYGGRMEGGMWFPDPENTDKGMAAYRIMEAMIRHGNSDPIDAAAEARRKAESIAAIAEKTAADEGLEGTELEARKNELIADLARQEAERYRKQKPALSREKPDKGGAGTDKKPSGGKYNWQPVTKETLPAGLTESDLTKIKPGKVYKLKSEDGKAEFAIRRDKDGKLEITRLSGDKQKPAQKPENPTPESESQQKPQKQADKRAALKRKNDRDTIRRVDKMLSSKKKITKAMARAQLKRLKKIDPKEVKRGTAPFKGDYERLQNAISRLESILKEPDGAPMSGVVERGTKLARK